MYHDTYRKPYVSRYIVKRYIVAPLQNILRKVNGNKRFTIHRGKQSYYKASRGPDKCICFRARENPEFPLLIQRGAITHCLSPNPENQSFYGCVFRLGTLKTTDHMGWITMTSWYHKVILPKSTGTGLFLFHAKQLALIMTSSNSTQNKWHWTLLMCSATFLYSIAHVICPCRLLGNLLRIFLNDLATFSLVPRRKYNTIVNTCILVWNKP